MAKHGKSDISAEVVDSGTDIPASDGYGEGMTPSPDAVPEGASLRGRKGSHIKEGQAAYIQKSTRMRKVLIAIIIVLVLLIGAGVFFGYQLFETARTAATQQTQTAISEVDSIDAEGAAKDASTTTSKRTTVPDLVALLGMTPEQAIETLQHGATLTSSVEVNEEGNPVKREVRIALTEEPADNRSGTPTVFMSLDESGVAIQTGYSVATSTLGYGSLSFADAINNEYIIEKTLEEAGLNVPVGSVTLPADKAQYSTYASDGTTLTRENCSFEGQGSAAGQTLNWSAVLSYDYSMANATGNLVDTIRTIFVYVSRP